VRAGPPGARNAPAPRRARRRGAERRARLGERSERAKREQLHAGVAKHRALRGAHRERQLAGVGRELIEQRILAAAASHAQAIEGPLLELLDLALHPSIREREALERAARERARVSGFGLRRLGTEALDRGDHGRRIEETSIVGIDQRAPG
jgi:hypothetical protein